MRIQWFRAVLHTEDTEGVNVSCHGIARGEYSVDAVHRLPPGIRGLSAAPITALARTSHDECTVFARFIVPEAMVPDCFHSIWDLSSGSICVPGIRVRMVSDTDTEPSPPLLPLPKLCEIYDTRSQATTTSTNERTIVAMSMLARFTGRQHWEIKASRGTLVIKTNLCVAYPGIHLTRQVVSADGLCAAPCFLSGRLLWEETRKLLNDDSGGNLLTDVESCKQPAVRVYVRTRVSKTGIARSKVVDMGQGTNVAIMGIDLSDVADGMALRFVRVHTFGRYVIVQNTPDAACVRQTPPFDAETTVDLLPLQTAFDRNESRCPIGAAANGGNPDNGLRVFNPPHYGGARFILRSVDPSHDPNQVRVTCTGTAVSTIYYENVEGHNLVAVGNMFDGLLDGTCETWEG